MWTRMVIPFPQNRSLQSCEANVLSAAWRAQYCLVPRNRGTMTSFVDTEFRLSTQENECIAADIKVEVENQIQESARREEDINSERKHRARTRIVFLHLRRHRICNLVPKLPPILQYFNEFPGFQEAEMKVREDRAAGRKSPPLKRPGTATRIVTRETYREPTPRHDRNRSRSPEREDTNRKNDRDREQETDSDMNDLLDHFGETRIGIHEDAITKAVREILEAISFNSTPE
ncbi:hypothetical protein K469DRAFT_686646 [Zopfia rhizophila CBS 207.26]|uniref:Uncharacterized protein n=1 Tax=Zopfia rhizophila CBS 207.26 TaxID=1314779 RepID=A0A6A6EV51_9PEZI|nr:hypothetical protein K469DRAFT_686646 [Zopfia rhizophila CBS 207.26]